MTFKFRASASLKGETMIHVLVGEARRDLKYSGTLVMPKRAWEAMRDRLKAGSGGVFVFEELEKP